MRRDALLADVEHEPGGRPRRPVATYQATGGVRGEVASQPCSRGQSVALSDSVANRGDLLTVLLRNPAAIGVVRGAGTPLRVIDLAPDGRTLVVGDSHGTVEYLDAITHRRIGAPYKAGDAIRGVHFSPDGSRLAVTGYQVGGTATAFVDRVDVRRRRSVRVLLAPAPGYIEFVGGVAFSPTHA
jgi:WD40 repeat protein